MTRRLVYVIGPSGAGKDSVLSGLREAWVGMPPAHWARRTITRAAQAGGEANECVDHLGFERLQAAGAFAMHWQAHEHCYGIRSEELAPLAAGHCVFVNGSRAHVPVVIRHWPDATVVQITAPAQVLAQRLRARNREGVQAISDRLARAVEVDLPADTISIVNDGRIVDAVELLLGGLKARLLAPTVCTR